MGFVWDRVRLEVARRLVSLAQGLTATVEAKHRRNVAKAMVRNAMLLPTLGAVTTKKRD